MFTCFLNSRSRALKPLSTLPLVYSSLGSHNFAKQGNFCKRGFAANFLSVYGSGFLLVYHSGAFTCLPSEFSLQNQAGTCPDFLVRFLYWNKQTRHQNSEQTVFLENASQQIRLLKSVIVFLGLRQTCSKSTSRRAERAFFDREAALFFFLLRRHTIKSSPFRKRLNYVAGYVIHRNQILILLGKMINNK